MGGDKKGKRKGPPSMVAVGNSGDHKLDSMAALASPQILVILMPQINRITNGRESK